ncbi:MAG TPA: ferredoxin [Candidatus Dormibacteraeota bacterium]|jgi:ferredoxin|nr:ferredoxin [Candidatus Dormibacteraeota bacterium]
MKVVVDRDLCESNARCMEVAPEVFLVDDNGDLQVLQEHPGEELRGKVELAVLRCPKQALSIVEEG